MGIFDKFRGTETKSVPAPEYFKENPVAHVDAGYIRETYAPWELKQIIELSGNHPLAFRCIRMIASQAAQAKFVAYQENGDVDEDITALINQPNPDGSGSDFRRDVYMDLAGTGNAVITPFRDARNNITELWSNRFDRMMVTQDRRGAIETWTYSLGNKTQVFPASDVLHIKHGWIKKEMAGVGSVCPMSSTLKAWDGYHAWNNQLLNGAQGVSEILALDNDTPLTESQFKDVMAGLRMFSLSAQNGKIGGRIALNAKLKSISRGVSPAELHVTEWYDRLTKSILNGFGIPPILLDAGSSTTYENQREARLSFWEDTLLPEYVDVLADGLSRYFGVKGVKVKPDIEGIPALAERRCERMVKLNGVSYMTMNEKREAVGLPPVDGGGVILAEASKIPLEIIAGGDAEPSQKAVEYEAMRRGVDIVLD